MTHRLAHEHTVRRALTHHAYGDVPEKELGVAARSALVHLLKLEAEGHAAQQSGQWVSREG